MTCATSVAPFRMTCGTSVAPVSMTTKNGQFELKGKGGSRQKNIVTAEPKVDNMRLIVNLNTEEAK